jgi:hypothetical protein
VYIKGYFFESFFVYFKIYKKKFQQNSITKKEFLYTIIYSIFFYNFKNIRNITINYDKYDRIIIFCKYHILQIIKNIDIIK